MARMDLRKTLILFSLLFIINLLQKQQLAVSANLVLDVKHKFGGARNPGGLKHLRAHDAKRHARLLLASSATAVQLPLGGNGLPTEAGSLFYFIYCCFDLIILNLYLFL